jgi:hypothetical protein
MNDFCKNEWEELCERTRRCADHMIAKSPKNRFAIESDCEKFCTIGPPASYSELLQRTSEARDYAIKWKKSAVDQDQVLPA